MSKKPKRGDIFLVQLDPVLGSEQGGTRPCVVIQNDKGNAFAPTTVVIPLSASIPDTVYPFHALLQPDETGLPKPCVAKCEHLKVVAIQSRFIKRLGSLSNDAMLRLEKSLLYELGMFPQYRLAYGEEE